MTQFKREERYIVIKRSDLAKIPAEVGIPFTEQLTAIQRRFPKRECLVIESDWPEYPVAWAMIEARMTGKQTASVVMPDAVRRAAAEMDRLGYGHHESHAESILSAAAPHPVSGELIRFDYINADGNPDSKMITHDEMRERYATPSAAQDVSGVVPEGWKLVPIEPTEVMQDAGVPEMPTVDCHPYDAGVVYKAMLAAAPHPVSGEQKAELRPSWLDGGAEAVAMAKEDEVDLLRALSVTHIMLDVVPGKDGMGEEVYARSVADVELTLSKMGDQIETLEDERNAATQRADAAERKLSEAVGLLRDITDEPRLVVAMKSEHLSAIRLLLSASAEPAKGGDGEGQ